MEKNNAHKRQTGFYYFLRILSLIATVIVCVALIAIIAYVLINGLDKLSLDLLIGEYKEESPSILPAFIGTVELVIISALIAVPIGCATAVYLVEYTGRKGKLVKKSFKRNGEKVTVKMPLEYLSTATLVLE